MSPAPPVPDDIAELRSALLAHYDREARELPWRRDRDPYRVLVSEIMLQQTRVATVLGYYEPWLERFPTVEALADAGEDEILKAWEGLGYYRRARNLHRAARIIRERSGGCSGASGVDGTGLSHTGDAPFSDAAPRDADRGFPSTYERLRELPGVGEYTAGAVASIVFDEVVPAVDGNVRRVLARLFDEPDPRPAWLRERASALIEPARPGDWNQAVMELGATVCTPRAPDCPACPVARWCAARGAGTQERRPAPSTKREVASANFVLAVLERDGRVLVERRPEGGLLGGLWALPEARLDGRELEQDATEARNRIVSMALGIVNELGFEGAAADPRALAPVRHRFSHLAATYRPVALLAGAREDDPEFAERPTRWIDPAGDGSTALPTAQRRVLDAWLEASGRGTEVV